MNIASFTSAGPSAPAGSFASAGSFTSAGPSAPAGPSVPAGSSASAGSSLSTGLSAPVNVSTPASPVLSLHTGLSVIQDMSKPFFIGKPVTALDNITAQMYIKATIWIGGIPFPNLDEGWEYMLEIPDDDQQHEIAKDIAHQQVLWTKKMGYKHKDMARLLQRDWQSVGMAKETMTDLVFRLQQVVMTLKKNYGNR